MRGAARPQARQRSGRRRSGRTGHAVRYTAALPHRCRIVACTRTATLNDRKRRCYTAAVHLSTIGSRPRRRTRSARDSIAPDRLGPTTSTSASPTPGDLMTIKIECVLECGNHLGEGPVWDVEEGCLYWVDGTGRRVGNPSIWRLDPRTRQDATLVARPRRRRPGAPARRRGRSGARRRLLLLRFRQRRSSI